MSINRGFTLIEWLISCVIGLFLMSAILSVYVMVRNNSHRLQIYNEMQENGRIALGLLEKDLKMTGFFGELSNQFLRLHDNVKTRVNLNQNLDCQDERGKSGGSIPSSGNHGVLRPLIIRSVNKNGALNSDISCLTKLTLQKNSDVLMLKRLYSHPVSHIPTSWDPKRIYLAANSEQGLFFYGADKKSIDEVSQLSNAEIMEYQHHIYFVQQSNKTPELRLIQLTDQMNASLSLPLVQGIERIRTLVAVDTSIPPDGITDKYIVPEQVSATIWNTFSITGIQIFILIRALEESPDYINSEQYQLANEKISPFKDHYQRMVMQSSIQFINSHRPRNAE